ncbi:MAG: ABC transporter ATP-binding protein [Firmicutes bacterium]|nr:ABC transporter ATP-binding protein [Bacillota bacterium]
MAEEVLMRMENVSRTFVMGEIRVEALKDTCLDLLKGELVVILGPSGSGKSTLLNIIGGLDLPSSGDVFFGGKNLSHADDEDLTDFRRNEIGFVFQFYNLISDLTARENVELAANLVERPIPVEQIMSDVGLGERMDHFPSQLSGGEQQRVAIARAAAKNPRLLLCDEPTGALDFQTGQMILSLLSRINQERGSTVVIVTHNTAISAMARRVIRMSSGRVVEVSYNPSPLPPERIEW